MQMPVNCSRCGDTVELNDTRMPVHGEWDMLWCQACMEALRRAGSIERLLMAE